MTVAGWYDDGAGGKRWWDGSAWTEHRHYEQGRPSVDLNTQQQRLSEAVAKYVNQGWSVMPSPSSTQALLQRKKRIGVFWNLVLSVITGGLWLIVVIIRVVNRKLESKVLTVDAYGNVR